MDEAEREVLRRVRPALQRVVDPRTGSSVWLEGLVQRPRVAGGELVITLVPHADHAEADLETLEAGLIGALRLEGVELPVRVERGSPEAPAATVPPTRTAPAAPLEGVRAVVAVASGKGGVGKSTVSANLAVGLAARGLRVGLFDADVHGPSAPTMLGVEGRPVVDHGRIQPKVGHGVKVLSMGLVADPVQPMIWRGPMVTGAIQQLLREASWAPLDVLIVDLPPGTGDAQLALVEATPLAGAVIVTTPQDVALADAVRGIELFRKLGVPLLGLVENMAYYPHDDGTKDFVFGEGGGARTAERYGVPLLGQLPLRTAVRVGGDTGRPMVLDDGPDAAPWRHLADALLARLETVAGAAGAR